MVGKQKQTQKGFTIIEVLIVLAIAGLIMAVVFLAVPALQRNSRNNARKTDARFIAVQRLQYNIDQNTSASISPVGAYCNGSSASMLFCSYIKNGLGYYDIDKVYFYSNTNVKPTTVPSLNPATQKNEIRTDSYTKCASNGRDVIASDDKRDMTVIYLIEVGNDWQQMCVQNGLAPKS